MNRDQKYNSMFGSIPKAYANGVLHCGEQRYLPEGMFQDFSLSAGGLARLNWNWHSLKWEKALAATPALEMTGLHCLNSSLDTI